MGDTCDKLKPPLQHGRSPSSPLKTLEVKLQGREEENYTYPEEPLDCGLDPVETDSAKELERGCYCPIILL